MSSFLPSSPRRPSLDIFRPIRRKLDGYNVKTPKIAHFLCGIIPAQCPFERQLQIGGRTLVKIPPLCKLNPLYEEVSALRFRALCFLADQCGEDISRYC